MKKLIIISFLLIHNLIFSQEKNNIVTLTNYISYNVSTSDLKDAKIFGKKIYDLMTDTNIIKNYQCYLDNPLEDEFWNIGNEKEPQRLNVNDLKKLIFVSYKERVNKDGSFCDDINDTTSINKCHDTIINRNLRIDTTQNFRFGETWSYDTTNLKFYKKVNLIAPGVKVYETDLITLKGYRRIFFTKLNQNKNIDTLFHLRSIEYDVSIAKYYLDNCTTWNPEDNIEPTPRREFIKSVISAIRKGKVKAYKDSTKNNQIKSIDDFFNIINIEYPKNVREYKISPMSIDKIRFIEEWIFDNNHQCFIKKVRGMGFVAEEVFKKEFGKQILFWIFFD